jgi:hypothetical protein
MALCTRRRRALTSLTALTLLNLCDYPFYLYSKLLSLLHLKYSTRSDILTLPIFLLSPELTALT